MEKKLDWARKVIEELEDVKAKIASSDDAIKYFKKYYAEGDSIEACNKYNAAAREIITLDNGQNYLIIFPDGSGFADWHEGINCFYPDASDALTEEEWQSLGR